MRILKFYKKIIEAGDQVIAKNNEASNNFSMFL